MFVSLPITVYEIHQRQGTDSVVRILLHLGYDVRTPRGSISFPTETSFLEARHSHLPWSSRNYHGTSAPPSFKIAHLTIVAELTSAGILRMVGLGSLRIGRINARTCLTRRSVMSPFYYIHILPSSRFARYCLGCQMWKSAGCWTRVGGEMGK